MYLLMYIDFGSFLTQKVTDCRDWSFQTFQMMKMQVQIVINKVHMTYALYSKTSEARRFSFFMLNKKIFLNTNNENKAITKNIFKPLTNVRELWIVLPNYSPTLKSQGVLQVNVLSERGSADKKSLRIPALHVNKIKLRI